MSTPQKTPGPHGPHGPHGVRIAATMMLKNESKRLGTTLKSLEGYIAGLIIFDTGSTDNTIEILREWSAKEGVPLHLKEGTFQNFRDSRNELFDFADTIKGYDFLLLLDCNDELRGGARLLEECRRFQTMKENVFMIRQQWLSGAYINKYHNARLVKPNIGWRYKKRVHECLVPPPGDTNIGRPIVSEDVVLYQDRNEDDDKTSKRFKRDKDLLLQDLKEENDTRDMFYLAQTHACLSEFEEAYAMYQKRAETLAGFWEERYHAYLRSGEIMRGQMQDTEMAIANFFKAAAIDFRAEPLIALGRIYREKHDFLLSYTFLHAASKLSYPDNVILFVSERDYVYERFQLLSIVAFYAGQYSEGRAALQKAKKVVNEIDIPDAINRLMRDQDAFHHVRQFLGDTTTGDVKQDIEKFLAHPNSLSFVKQVMEDPTAKGKLTFSVVHTVLECKDANEKNEESYNKIKGDPDIRSAYQPHEFPDEIRDIYQSYMDDGREALKTNPSQAILLFMRAFQISNRIPPLIMLAEYFRIIKAFSLSWCLVELALQMDTPANLTKKDKECYSYLRYHLAGIVGYYAGQFKKGKECCLKAIKEGINIHLDRKNLLHYLDAEKKQLPEGVPLNNINSRDAPPLAPPPSVPMSIPPVQMTEKGYTTSRVEELLAQNPKMDRRQALKKAQLEWKLRNLKKN